MLIMIVAMLAGCATSPAQLIDRRAIGAGLQRIQFDEARFPSLIYLKRSTGPGAAGRPLLVFLEGDGIPWTGAGTVPSDDPTTQDPMALELLINSPAPSAYVTRPCYQGLRPKNCTAEQWTGGRYSSEIVESMVRSVREALRRSGANDVALIGYSGGGVLAVLIGERLERVRAVVTVAANLDTDAWTKHHGYLPLSQSLNPSRSQLPHPWPEVHLQGGTDTVTPPATTKAYFDRFKRAERKIIANYDHLCCWKNDWEVHMRGLPLDVAQ